MPGWIEMKSSQISVVVQALLQLGILFSGCCRLSEAQVPVVSPEWSKGALSLKFYDQTCPQVESVVSSVFNQFVQLDQTLMGPLLRMAYHDCFVRGCDASILLDSTSTQPAEKVAPPNLNSIRGYEVYDAIKTNLEQPTVCPGIVSCADIVALVARDSVVKASGVYWPIYLGRRDGFFSSSTEAVNDIPGPSSTYPQLMSAFSAIGLSQHDLVTLSGHGELVDAIQILDDGSWIVGHRNYMHGDYNTYFLLWGPGAHTIGRTHCSTIMTRLYNFTGQGDTDPALNAAYATQLKQQCPQSSPSNTVPLDSTEFVFDKNYYDDLTNNKALFTSDVQLLTQRFPASIVADYVANGATSFFPDFTVSMQRMLVANVLTGTQGEVRTNCHVVNS